MLVCMSYNHTILTDKGPIGMVELNGQMVAPLGFSTDLALADVPQISNTVLALPHAGVATAAVADPEVVAAAKKKCKEVDVPWEKRAIGGGKKNAVWAAHCLAKGRCLGFGLCTAKNHTQHCGCI